MEKSEDENFNSVFTRFGQFWSLPLESRQELLTQTINTLGLQQDQLRCLTPLFFKCLTYETLRVSSVAILLVILQQDGILLCRVRKLEQIIRKAQQRVEKYISHLRTLHIHCRKLLQSTRAVDLPTALAQVSEERSPSLALRRLAPIVDIPQVSDLVHQSYLNPTLDQLYHDARGYFTRETISDRILHQLMTATTITDQVLWLITRLKAQKQIDRVLQPFVSRWNSNLQNHVGMIHACRELLERWLILKSTPLDYLRTLITFIDQHVVSLQHAVLEEASVEFYELLPLIVTKFNRPLSFLPSSFIFHRFLLSSNPFILSRLAQIFLNFAKAQKSIDWFDLDQEFYIKRDMLLKRVANSDTILHTDALVPPRLVLPLSCVHLVSIYDSVAFFGLKKRFQHERKEKAPRNLQYIVYMDEKGLKGLAELVYTSMR